MNEFDTLANVPESDAPYRETGELLVRLRELAGLGPGELAERLRELLGGTARRWRNRLYSWQTGRVKIPLKDAAPALSDILADSGLLKSAMLDHLASKDPSAKEIHSALFQLIEPPRLKVSARNQLGLLHHTTGFAYVRQLQVSGLLPIEEGGRIEFRFCLRPATSENVLNSRELAEGLQAYLRDMGHNDATVEVVGRELRGADVMSDQVESPTASTGL